MGKLKINFKSTVTTEVIVETPYFVKDGKYRYAKVTENVIVVVCLHKLFTSITDTWTLPEIESFEPYVEITEEEFNGARKEAVKNLTEL